MRFCLSVLLAAGILMLTVPSHAHHASAPFFHQDRSVEIQGVVSKWIFVNPHPQLYVEVTDENGATVVWEIGFAPATVLAKRGWGSGTFTPGEVITANGRPSKAPGTHGLGGARITRADGTPVGR